MITTLPKPLYRSEILQAPSSGRRWCRILIGPLKPDGPSLAYRLDDFDDKAWVTPLSYEHDLETDPAAVLEDFNRGVDQAVEEGFRSLDGSRPDPLEQIPDGTVAGRRQVTVEKLIGKH